MFSIELEDRRKLLRHARDVIAASLGEKDEPEPPVLKTNIMCGAFVTLHRHGQLRGCIGRMYSPAPLADTVAEMARAAAFEDPRFPPVNASELADLEIEITLLSPLAPIEPEAVRVGTHGLLISAFGRSGVLLPQVPVEYGWDRETFLAQVCRKAGLPPDAWKSPMAQLYGFEGFVFSEKELEQNGA